MGALSNGGGIYRWDTFVQTLSAQLTYQKLDTRAPIGYQALYEYVRSWNTQQSPRPPCPPHFDSTFAPGRKSVQLEHFDVYCVATRQRNKGPQPRLLLSWGRFHQSVQVEHFAVFAQRPALLEA